MQTVHSKVADFLDARETEKRNATAFGAFYLYERWRRIGDPKWEDLTPSQQARFKAGFLIGAQSVDRAKVFGS